MRRSIYERHPYARELMTGDGYNEASAVWEYGLGGGPMCKLRVDRLTTSPDGWPTVLDIKTISEATDRKIEYAIRDQCMHVQGIHYLEGLNVVAPSERKWVLLFLESQAPYNCRVVEVDHATMELGRRKHSRFMAQYRECLESGYWPGYAEGLEQLGVPQFEFEKELDELDEESFE